MWHTGPAENAFALQVNRSKQLAIRCLENCILAVVKKKIDHQPIRVVFCKRELSSSMT